MIAIPFKFLRITKTAKINSYTLGTGCLLFTVYYYIGAVSQQPRPFPLIFYAFPTT